MSYDNCYFITLTLINNSVLKKFKELLTTYPNSIWVMEKGKKGTNPHLHCIFDATKKIRTDNITLKFKSILYSSKEKDKLMNTRRLVQTKQCYDMGTLYNGYFKKEGVDIHISGWDKKVLDKLPIKDNISLAKIMKDITVVSKVNAPYVIYEYSVRKKLQKENFIKIITKMINEGYALSHLFGRTMKHIQTGYFILCGSQIISYKDIFGEEEHIDW